MIILFVIQTKSRDGDDLVVAPPPVAREKLAAVVDEILATTPVLDIHTHLFPTPFGDLGLWGIDDLLTYHYLEAELFRFSSIQPAQYWELSKTQRADLVWKTLFQENTPISEAARGVVAVLACFGAGSFLRNTRTIARLFPPAAARRVHPPGSGAGRSQRPW